MEAVDFCAFVTAPEDDVEAVSDDIHPFGFMTELPQVLAKKLPAALPVIHMQFAV